MCSDSIDHFSFGNRHLYLLVWLMSLSYCTMHILCEGKKKKNLETLGPEYWLFDEKIYTIYQSNCFWMTHYAHIL